MATHFRHHNGWRPERMGESRRILLGHLTVLGEQGQKADPTVHESVLRLIATREHYQAIWPGHSWADELTAVIHDLTDTSRPMWQALNDDTRSALIIAAAN